MRSDRRGQPIGIDCRIGCYRYDPGGFVRSKSVGRLELMIEN
jgi:hypothetical protein